MSTSLNETVETPLSLQIPHAVPTPNDPPWNTGMAIGVWLLSVFLIMVIPGVFLAPYALSLRSDFPDSSELVKALSSDPVAILIQIAAIVPAHLLTIGIAWLVVTRRKTYPFLKTLGWRLGGMKWWHFAVILAAFFLLSWVIGSLLPEQENELIRMLKSSRNVVFLVAFMATFTAPLVEEVVYRGLLYAALQRSVGVQAAVAIVTLLFAAVHLPQYWPSVSTMILLTTLSLILTIVRVRTDNLLPCVILHTIFNAIQSSLLIAGPYIEAERPAEEAIGILTHLIK